MDKLTPWTTLTMAADKPAKINISGYIGVPEWWQHDEEQAKAIVSTKEKMRSELETIANLKADTIEVEIDSFGGDVNHGLSMYNALANNPATIKVIYTGWSASIATVIAAAGDVVEAPNNWMGLIHEGRGLTMGTKNDIEAYAKFLERCNSVVADIYATKGGHGKEVYAAVMAEANGEGEWRTADDLHSLGLVDVVTEPMAAAASFEDQMIEMQKFGLKTNNITMGILSKKTKRLTPIKLGEVDAVFNGELKAGISFAGVGADVADGTFEVEGNSLVVENSILKSITPAAPEMVEASVAAQMVADATAQMQADLDAANASLVAMTEERDELQVRCTNLETLTSNHKPEKKGGVNNAVTPDISSEINMIVKEGQKETAQSINKKRKGA